MATARRAWFRVACDVVHAGHTNDELAFMVRLMAYMTNNWARSGLSATESATVRIPVKVLLTLTDKGRRDAAVRSAQRLADIVSMSVEDRGDFVTITWPKFPKFQGFRTLELPQSAPAPASARAPAKKREERPPAATVESPPLDGKAVQRQEAKTTQPLRETPEANDPGGWKEKAAVVWPRLSSAAEHYGSGPWQEPTRRRLDALARWLRQHNDPAGESAEKVIHGAAKRWSDLPAIASNMKFETLFGAKSDSYLEAYGDAAKPTGTHQDPTGRPTPKEFSLSLEREDEWKELQRRQASAGEQGARCGPSQFDSNIAPQRAPERAAADSGRGRG